MYSHLLVCSGRVLDDAPHILTSIQPGSVQIACVGTRFLETEIAPPLILRSRRERDHRTGPSIPRRNEGWGSVKRTVTTRRELPPYFLSSRVGASWLADFPPFH